MAMKPVKRAWTVEEYLAYELETGIKHEYIEGEIYAMTGGTDKHSKIKTNTVIALGKQREQAPCSIYDSDMRTKIADKKYVYPDMSVVCGESVFADKEYTMLTNPTFVVEVLSETSADYDKGTKADYYFSLASVNAYLLLAQDRAHAQLYTRHEAGWLLREFIGLDVIVPLEAIGCTLPLKEAYWDIHF